VSLAAFTAERFFRTDRATRPGDEVSEVVDEPSSGQRM